MIKYENTEVDNLFTEGFEASLSASTLSIAAGIFSRDEKGSAVVRSYPAIEFDLEADDELPVVYDVYLLEENDEDGLNIHLDRTELGYDDVPFYDGETPLLHCLASITIPPGTTDFDALDITIRTLVKGATTDETPTEE